MNDHPIGIVGMGYVGLPLALVFCEAGRRVIGFDIDADKVASLERGESYIRHIGPERVAAAHAAGHLLATGDFARIPACAAILICVPTPLDAHRDPDLHFIEDTCRAIAPHLAPHTLVVLESTTWPGCTEELVLPLLEDGSGRRLGRDLLVAFSPEREDPGNPDFGTAGIPKLVGGLDAASTEAAVALYRSAIATVIPLSHAKVAEAAKLLENIFRSVNIALVNEMKIILTAMDIDVHEVIDAAATKPFGFMRFDPGPGLGGHCIPIDPFYLAWKAREHGVPTRFIELAGEINRRMPSYVVHRTMEALNNQGKALKGAKILLVGIAYKPDVDDDRESPSYKIWQLLADRGAEISYHDPHIPIIRPTREYPHLAGTASIDLQTQADHAFDAVILITQHHAVDPQQLSRLAPTLIDTRNSGLPQARPA